MNEEDLRAWLDSVPPEERKAMLESLFASYAERGEQLDVEQDRADVLRETPGPQMYNAGRFKVAANPLEFLGAGAQRGVGEYQANKVATGREAMASQKEQALQKLVAEILRRKTGPTPPLPAGAPTGPIGGPGAYPPSGVMSALSAALRR
jgi:hypothetical protein